MDTLRIATASQTVGPFFRSGMQLERGSVLFGPDAAGRRIHVQGRMLDREGAPVADAVIEVWQCDASGRFGGAPSPSGAGRSEGFGRVYTDDKGGYSFSTLMPGMPAGSRNAAPHLLLIVFARGLLRHVHTRLYFDSVAENAMDGVLLSVPAERRASLIAARSPQDSDSYQFDIRLSGAGETVFFSY
jgi:protocatechuate 3,4-dioxygenase alpha subunit